MATYLLQRTEIYYYRRRIPADCRASLGKREICESLHTKVPRQAASLAQQRTLHNDQLLREFAMLSRDSDRGETPIHLFRTATKKPTSGEAPLTKSSVIATSTAIPDFSSIVKPKVASLAHPTN